MYLSFRNDINFTQRYGHLSWPTPDVANINQNRAEEAFSENFTFDEKDFLIYLFPKRHPPSRQSVYLQRFQSHIANLAENVNIFKDNHNYENYRERDSRCACCK